jgi:hypothetical protein
MKRSIENRLKQLEAKTAPEKPDRKSHIFGAKNDEERDAMIAGLKAAGADANDMFIQLVGVVPSRGEDARN